MDIQEFNEISTMDFKKGKAMQIYDSYIKEDALFEIGGVKPEWRKDNKGKVECAAQSRQRNGSIESSLLFATGVTNEQ